MPATDAQLPSGSVDQAATAPAIASGTARPVALGGDEPDHFTADGETTLCGVYVHAGAWWPAHVNRRRVCLDCRRVLRERKLTVEAGT